MEIRYKFRIYPTREQKLQIQTNFNCSRFVYNFFLAESIERYKAGKGIYSYNDASRDLTLLKRKDEYQWLYEADASSLQCAIKHMTFAYSDFFRRVRQGGIAPGFPNFKSKRETRQSYECKNNTAKQSVAITEKHIKLPKLGLVRCKVSKHIEGRILAATVLQSSSGRYYVSVSCTDFAPPLPPKTDAVVGIRMGIRTLATTSDGQRLENNRCLEKSYKKLARLQRQMSRKPKDSKNREKARVKLAREHEKISNKRTDAMHKLTTKLVNDYDVICVRDEPISKMVRNPFFAGCLTDAGWGKFVRQLTYKCKWYDKEFVQISNWHTSSQLCSSCGYHDLKKNKKTRYREWDCPSCGAHHDSAINTAVNILHEGLRQTATS